MSITWVPYYIDYNVQNAAKTIGASKKRVTFKFGIANQKAIEDGLVGAHCRGSEHEVVFKWSLNSGKRHMMLDGKDVHFSESGQNGWTNDRTWQHVFSLNVRGLGIFKCHFITQPAPSGTNIRPYDLRVNGVSIFRFNKIFQLGTASMQARRHAGGAGDENMSKEEAQNMAIARLESMKDYRKQQEKEAAMKNVLGPEAPPPPAEESLIIFGPTPGAPPPMPERQGYGPAVSSLTMGSAFGSAYDRPLQGQGQQPPPALDYYGQQNAPAPYGYPQPTQSNALTPYQGSSNPYASPSAASQVSGATLVQSNLVPQQAYGYQQQPPIQQHQQQHQQYYQQQPLPSPMSTSGSIGTYGSAPSFARPPPTQQLQSAQPPPPQQQAYYAAYNNY